MFTPLERDRVRDALVAAAREDRRINGVAWFGSTAGGAQDEWSDVDLMLASVDSGSIPALLDDWTGRVYRDHGAVHHVDVISGKTVYRVFLLASTLQVDIAFSPADEFGAVTPAFRLLYGSEARRAQPRPPSAERLAGLGWLHALHARAAIRRGHVWQAEYMISGVRDHALALACIRHGLPAAQGRGVDRLPPAVLARFAVTIAGSVDRAELARAFRGVIATLIDEIDRTDAALAARLRGPLRELAVGV